MSKEKENSIFGELWNSIRYAIESKQGRFSLDSYLDIIGEYADQLIEKSEQEGLMYQGGHCNVSKEYDTYRFDVKMYFEQQDGEKVLKESSRNLDKSRFTTETEADLDVMKTFEITKGKRG